jgi:hypothetical protein
MQDRMEDLLRWLYGRRSESVDSDQLLLEELILSADGEGQRPEQPEPAEEIPAPPARKRRRCSGRQPLPEHLQRKAINIPVTDAARIRPVGAATWKAGSWYGLERGRRRCSSRHRTGAQYASLQSPILRSDMASTQKPQNIHKHSTQYISTPELSQP